MKTIKFFSIVTLVFSMFLIGCSPSENSAEGGGNNGGEPSGGTPTAPKSITLKADKTSFDQGGTITFTVKTNLGTNVTSKSSIKVNGVAITGNTYTPATHGTFKAKATYESFVSSELSFTVNEILPNVTVTSVAVEADKTAVEAGGVVTFTSKVTYSDGSVQDKTSETVFTVDGTEIKGNKYIGFNIGTMNIKGVFSSVSSDNVSVQVSQIATPSNFTKKGVIEDYTGTWCGWCPRVSHAIELVEAQSNKVFAIAAHIGDAMENSHSTALKDAFGVNSYPTAYVNREAKWISPEPNNVSQATSVATGTTNLGLSINSTLSGETMQIVVSAGFAQNTPGTKLVVFILEDGILANQSNNTSYYGGANPIVNFEHNHVLRYSVTNVLGDPIATTAGVVHTSYTVNLGLGANVADGSKTGVIAMLVDGTGKKVLNAQYAKVNVDKKFD